MRGTLLLLLAATVGCGDDDGPAPATMRPEVMPAPGPAAPAAPGETPAPEATDEPGPLVDLLTSAPTVIRVSSVYDGDESQVRRLADGDPTTAWNSRSGDLEGAWIRIELPDDAEVSFVQMTVGYTKPGGRTDLFTGNHRISRVRIRHEGTIVSEPMLDVTNRGLQTLPVDRKGGTIDIEVDSVVQGSRSDWREICVSELKVMERAPSAQPGSRRPEFLVGRPPGEDTGGEAEVDLDSLETPEDAEDAMFAAMAGALDKALEYDRLLITGDLNPASLSSEERASRLPMRQRMFTQVAIALATIDPGASALMREAAQEQTSDWRWATRKDDFMLLTATVDRGFDRSGVGGDTQGLWARDNVAHWVDRLEILAEQITEAIERQIEELMDTNDPPYSRVRTLRSEADPLYGFVDPLDRAVGVWDEEPERGAAMFQAIDAPTHELLAPEWAAMSARIAVTRIVCGW